MLAKRSKLWPVLGILGPRQVGKSTFLRELWAKKQKANYVTFDRDATRGAAEKAPESFLQTHTQDLTEPLIIDEAQKVPKIFDSIKALVDERRRPGLFTLSGSTEFSDRSHIHESLTGRIGILKMYPMILREIHSGKPAFPILEPGAAPLKVSAADVSTRIQRGGMPGICSLRSEDERFSSWESWISTSCERDLLRLKGARWKPNLAKEILKAVAVAAEAPRISEIAAALGVDSRIVSGHVKGLQALFVLQGLEPHPKGVGQTRYHLMDSGLAHYLGASYHNCSRIWLLNEIYAQYEYAGRVGAQFYYFQTAKSRLLDLVIEERKQRRVFLFAGSENPSTYDLRTLLAAKRLLKTGEYSVIHPGSEAHKSDKQIRFINWTSVG